MYTSKFILKYKLLNVNYAYSDKQKQVVQKQLCTIKLLALSEVINLRTLVLLMDLRTRENARGTTS